MSPPSLPALIGERYRPLRLVGRGGGGVVYEVEHIHTGARLALKALSGFENASPETVARFRREARLAAAIESDHVVRITDAGTAAELDGAPFLVMELMQGQTLEREAQGPMPPADVVELLTQVARALERAHAHGIVHRDLKPDNLFITRREDGRAWVKVLDFGIAKRAGEGSTEQGTVLGTPTYMSPEQAQGHGDQVDRRTDTWALGLVAYRLLSGRPYFEPDTALRLLHRVVFEPLPPPSELGCRISELFDSWFLRSCSRDLSQRYVSSSEQIRDLAHALEGADIEILERPTLERARAARAELDSLSSASDHGGPVTAPASTPPAELKRTRRRSRARSLATSSVPSPLPAATKRRWFALGAALAALLLLALVFALDALIKRPETAHEQSSHSAASAAGAAEPNVARVPGDPTVLEPPTLRAPEAPLPASNAGDSAPKAKRPVRQPSPAELYDPLGDQR